VDWELRQRDYIEAFVPMVVECIRVAEHDAIALKDIQNAVALRFGLTLPLNALRTVLHRAARHGYLRPEHGVYVRDTVRCASLSFADTETKVSRLHEHVVQALASYAQARFQSAWTPERAEGALLNFLASDDWQVVQAGVQGSPIIEPPAAPDSDNYIVGTFVYSSHASDPGMFEALETLAKGHMLANVLYLPDLGKVEQRFRDTRLYFDTTFLIYALGYAGDDRQAPCAELLEVLHEFGAELRCFEDTVEEVRGVLDACSNRVLYNQLATAYGPAIEHFLARGLSAGDIALLSANLPEKLAYLRIKVEDKPPYLRHYVIDELALQNHLQTEVGYRHPQACVHDVDCISAVMRLRRGHGYSSVELCKALFVTTNVALAIAAKSFFHDPQHPNVVPPCFTDYWIGNLLWLKGPTKAPSLPRKLIIADAYAALQPPPELWKHYLAEILKTKERGQVSDDQYYILRYSAAARAAVMDLTKGRVQAFTEGTVAEVLELAKENIRADLQQELLQKGESLARIEESLAEKDRAVADLTARREAERQTLANRITALEELEHARDERRTVSARRWAHAFLIVPRTLAFLVVLFGTVLTFPWQLPPFQTGLLRYGASVALALLFVVTVVASYWGTAVKSLITRLEDRLSRWLKVRFDRLGL
jgi:hypothetical protein